MRTFAVDRDEFSSMFNTVEKARKKQTYPKSRSEERNKPQISESLCPGEIRQIRLNRGDRLGLFNGGKVVSFQGCKGGIGKSTLSYNFAIRAFQYGNRVLCVDCDQQAHLTLCLDDKEDRETCWLDIFEGTVRIKDALVSICPQFDLVPSSLRMAVAEKRIGNTMHPKRIFKNFIEEIVEDYDIVVIDCAPALSSINHAVAYASDVVVIPQVSSRLSTDGLELTMDFLGDLEEDYGVKPTLRIVCNLFSQVETPSLRTMYDLLEKHDGAMMKTAVRRCVKFPEAVDCKRSVFELGKKRSIAYEDLDAFTRELLGMGGASNG